MKNISDDIEAWNTANEHFELKGSGSNIRRE